MQVNNPIQMNGWEIKKFLKLIFSIQLAMWGAIGLDVAGLQIPIIRQIVSFIYLTFIPGIIILRVLKLHKLGDIETLLYTVGLSIATLMFTGLFINTIYPFFGISRPISTMSLIVTISTIVSILCVLCYIIDDGYSTPNFIDIKDLLSPPVLFLFLIPFLAIFGTYLVNFHRNNTLLIFMIIVISATVILIGFDKFIPKKLYPLAIFVIALSLLLHNSLISMYITGWDIQYEYYISNLIVVNSIWDMTIKTAVNAMLSIVMLVPFFSNLLGISPIWVLKIIYPLIFSLVPLGLYRIFQKQTNDKIAFLACFFFVSIGPFYTEMLGLARQEIAELFLVLLILSINDKNMDKMVRSFLMIVFGISLVTSHYGLSYIFMGCLISVWLLLSLSENRNVQQLINNFIYSKFNRHMDEKPSTNRVPTKIKGSTISSTYVVLFVVFIFTWYMNISRSASFNAIVQIGDHISSTISHDFLTPETAQGLNIIMSTVQPTLFSQLSRFINYLNQIFIIVGVLELLKHGKMKFEKEYKAFSLVNLFILFAGVSVPFFASSINMTRLYQITLIVLALSGVLGGIKILMVLSSIARMSWTKRIVRSTFQILTIYFVIFFLYQVGFVYGVAEGRFNSISLNNTNDYPRFNEQEVLGAKWLYVLKNKSNLMYSDEYRTLLLSSIDYDTAAGIPLNFDLMSKDSYIYFGTWNVMKDDIAVVYKSGVSTKYEHISSDNIANHRNKIYTNGGAEVYY